MQESYHMILLSCTDGHCPRHEATWPKAPPMLESAFRGFAAPDCTLYLYQVRV